MADGCPQEKNVEVREARKNYAVCLDGNSGTGGTKKVSAVYGEQLPKIAVPIKEGWLFDGYWTTVRDGGVQYYKADGTSARTWDKRSDMTLWAKWICYVKLGKNGGSGGNNYVTATFGQPLPALTPPRKNGSLFGGYWMSANQKKGKCYNADGSATAMKWMHGGSPIIWALWTRNKIDMVSGCIFLAFVTLVLLLSRKGGMSCYVVLLAATLLLSLPAPVNPVLPGLDPTYQWLVNRFAMGDVWGRDIVFTYGPLGFLVSPQLTIANVLLGIVFNLVCTAVFAYVALSLFRSERNSPCRAIAWMLLILAACPWSGDSMEWKWCYVSVLAVAVVVFDCVCNRLGRMILLSFAAFSAVVLTLAKFSMFLAVVPQQLALLGWFLAKTRGKGWRDLSVYFGGVVLASCLAVAALFHSVHDFLLWVRGSYEMSYGYNQYMVGDKSVANLLGPFALVLCLLAGLLWRNPQKARTLFYAFLFSPMVFCAYKYAIIRHMKGLVPLAHLCMGISLILPLALRSHVRRGRLLAALSLLVALLSIWIYVPGVSQSGISAKNLWATVCPMRSLREASAVSRKEFCHIGIPSDWKARIGTNSVMIAGSDYGIVMESGLNLKPLPALQLYSAYTKYLDELCADSLRPRSGRNGMVSPQFLMLPSFPLSIDGRNTYLDNPAFWREVCRRFVIDKIGPEYILLKRRAAPVCPDTRMPVFRVELQASLVGRLFSFLFRPTKLFLEVTFTDGTVDRFAFNPLWANGDPQRMLIPTTPEEVIAFLGGPGTVKQIENLRISAQAPWYYRHLGVRIFRNGADRRVAD